MTLTLNKKIPDFQADSTAGPFILSKQTGKNLVLYFYPKDNTPGCTTEGANFRDNYSAFLEANTQIFGISRDSLRSHENFRKKMEFPFDLISDSEENLCNLFNVIKMKTLYGKQVRGIERSTFVLDRQGILKGIWRGVKVPGHVAEVLAFVQSLE